MFSAPSNYRHSMYPCYIRKASTINWRYLKLHKQNLTKVSIFKSYGFESIPTRCAEVCSETIVWYIVVSMNQCMKVRWLCEAVVFKLSSSQQLTKQCCKHVDDCLLEKSQEEFRRGGCCPKLLYFYSLSFEIIPI